MRKLLLTLICAAPLSLARADDAKDLAFSGFDYPISVEITSADQTGKVCYESSFSRQPEKEYDVVLVQGLMPDPDMRLDLIGKAKSIFSAHTTYTRTGFRRYPNGRFWARYQAPARTDRPIKFTVTDLGLKTRSTMVIYGTELMTDQDLREDQVPVSTAAYVPEADLFVPQAAPFKLLRRADWKALPSKSPYTRHTPRYFTYHHTQAHYPKTYADAVIEMQFIQDYHQNGRGWIDIGYHFLIDPAGNIFEGRPINVLGAHVANRNTANVGISFMGNYHPPAADLFSQLAQDSFVTLGRYVKDTYTVQVSSFYAHRDIGASDCPGDNLYAKKNFLRDLVFLAPQPAPVNQDVPLPPRQAEALERLKRYLGQE